jgi:uncharacterized membrane protein
VLDYFINVGLSFLPFFGATFGILFFVVFLPRVLFRIMGTQLDQSVKDIVLKGSLAVIVVILAVGLIFSFTASANTFKLEHHNKTQLNQRIENQNMNPSMGEIVDRTKKPELTQEERAARFKEITNY